MKKKCSSLVVGIFLLISLSVYAQSSNIQWQKAYGGSAEDYATSIQQTFDGGYIVAGYTMSNNGDVNNNHGDADYWIVRLNATGSRLWQKTYGGSSGERARSIQQTSDGGYIVAGEAVSNDGDVSGNHGSADYWIVKLNASGDTLWQKSLGGSYYDEAKSIQQTSDGGYIAAGYTMSNDGDVTGNHGDKDYWIVKLNSSGSIIWQKSFGGSAADAAYAIQQTKDGNYIVAGYTYSNDNEVSGNHGLADYWIVKLDTTGNILWQKTYGGSNNDFATAIQQSSDGGYIVAGYTWSNDGDVSSNHGTSDYWVVKLDISGNIIWQKTYGGMHDDFATSIQQAADGGYVVAGGTSSNDGEVSGNHGNIDYNDYWIVKLDEGASSIVNEAQNRVQMYPNPAHDQVTLSGLPLSCIIQIISIDGKVVYKHTAVRTSEIISTTVFAPGVYTLQIINDNYLSNKKLIIR